MAGVRRDAAGAAALPLSPSNFFLIKDQRLQQVSPREVTEHTAVVVLYENGRSGLSQGLLLAYSFEHRIMSLFSRCFQELVALAHACQTCHFGACMVSSLVLLHRVALFPAGFIACGDVVTNSSFAAFQISGRDGGQYGYLV